MTPLLHRFIQSEPRHSSKIKGIQFQKMNMDHLLNKPILHRDIATDIEYLKDITNFFNKQDSIGLRSGPSNEIICILSAQGATKL